MRLYARPSLSDLPRRPDVAVVGAGAAGIAAARRLLAAGLSVAVLEARDRVGGRAVTVALWGHPIDLGAHWLHAGSINPLVKLAKTRGEFLRRAPGESHLVIGGRRGSARERTSLGQAFARADIGLRMAIGDGEDRPIEAALRPIGPWAKRVAAVHALLAGRPLDEASLHDLPVMDYSDNSFIAGGVGAYLARLAMDLPIRLQAAVRTIDWTGADVRIEVGDERLTARAVIVTTPMPVLQAGAIRFIPDLPGDVTDALQGFAAGTYEHVVIHWPGSPFQGRDRLASLVGTRHSPPGLLTRIDGTAFHYLELDWAAADRLEGRDAGAPARFARAVLQEHFGPRALTTLSVPVATAWRHDPLSRASWAVVPPGRVAIRDGLKQPVADRIWFAGEALSRAQWGTVGGAWEDGERAAEATIRKLRRPAR